MKKDMELPSCRSTNHNPRPLESYLRHTVKVGFEAACGDMEHLWLDITGIDGEHLIGTVNSAPQLVDIDYGDEVVFCLTQIEEVLSPPDNWFESVCQLIEQSDYCNDHLGAPASTEGAIGLRMYYTLGYTPEHALRMWRDWEPLEDDRGSILEAVYRIKCADKEDG